MIRENNLKKFLILVLFLLLLTSSCVKDDIIYYLDENTVEYNKKTYIEYVDNEFFLPFLSDHSPYNCESLSISKNFIKATDDKNEFFIYDEFILGNTCFLLDGIQIPNNIKEIDHINKIICIKDYESIIMITDEQQIESIMNCFMSKTNSKGFVESDMVVYAISNYYGGSFCLTYNQAIIKDEDEYYFVTDNGLELVPQELFRDN